MLPSEASKFVWAITKKIIELVSKEQAVGFGAKMTIPGCQDLKLSCIQFLGHHGEANRFADGKTARRTQDKFELQLANGDVWRPPTKNLVGQISDDITFLKQITRAEINYDLREHGGQLLQSLRKDAGSYSIKGTNSLEDVDQQIIGQLA